MEKNKHFVVGVFNDQDILLEAIKTLRSQGVKIYEVFTPYPVHHLEDALGYKRSWMPTAAFLFGLLGLILAILMQTLMMGVDWPMIIGGKPYISIPDFVPVSFELTVLLAAFGMAFTFFGYRALHPFKVPRIFDRRSTDDKHIMAIDLATNKIEVLSLEVLLKEAEAEEVYRKDFSDQENQGAFGTYLANVLRFGVLSSSRKL